MTSNGAETGSVAPETELAFTRLTPPARPGADPDGPPPPAVVFLHGAESCALEFSRVAPFLEPDYDLFLVDLPGHSRSKHIPFGFESAVDGVARLIAAHVPRRDGQPAAAHIVGLSLGGFLALELAVRHPDRVRSVWCTGCAPLSGFRWWLLQYPRLLSGAVTLAGRLATDRIFWATLGSSDVQPIPGLRDAVRQNQNMATLTPVYAAVAGITGAHWASMPATLRVAIVAGGRMDNVEGTRDAGRVLQQANAASRAFVVRDAIHWWSLQLPELFAQGVRAWIEGRAMPAAYEPL